MLNYKNEVKNPYKGKTVAFCLPGRLYSGVFLQNFTKMLFDISSLGLNFFISQRYDPSVNHARTDCLDVDNYAGTMLVPFRGKIDYDYIMWIDSDIVFTTENFLDLLNMDKDISCGWYLQSKQMSITNSTCVVEYMSEDDLLKRGAYKSETAEDMMRRSEPFQIDYTGFGWVLMKKGIFEKIPYPWFAPIKKQLVKEDGTILEDMSSEDISMCLEFKKYGFEIWCNPQVRVGHEKTIVI